MVLVTSSNSLVICIKGLVPCHFIQIEWKLLDFLLLFGFFRRNRRGWLRPTHLHMNSQTRDLAHLVEGVELKGMAKILTGLTQQFGRELRLHSRLHPTSLLSKSLKDPSIPRAQTPLDAPKDAKNRQELEGKQEIMVIFEMKFGIHNQPKHFNQHLLGLINFRFSEFGESRGCWLTNWTLAISWHDSFVIKFGRRILCFFYYSRAYSQRFHKRISLS